MSGEPETKTIKDLLPDIIQQLGPKQSKLLESLVSNSGEGAEDVPDLVEDKPASTPQNLDSVEWSSATTAVYPINIITLTVRCSSFVLCFEASF